MQLLALVALLALAGSAPALGVSQLAVGDDETSSTTPPAPPPLAPPSGEVPEVALPSLPVPAAPPALGVPPVVLPPIPLMPSAAAAPGRRAAAAEALLSFVGLLGWRQVDAGNAADHAARAALLGKVRAQPGLHLRALARELGMTPQNASYHLRRLEALGLVASERPGRQRRYFPREGGRPLRDAGLTAAFLADARRAEMLAAVVQDPGIGPAEVARRLGVHRGSAHWGLRRLAQRGYIEPLAEGYAPTSKGALALAPP